MSVSVRDIGSGKGWRVSDVICSAGPQQRPFEEVHHEICIAIVTDGTFLYRAPQGRAMLAPGSVLLGNQGKCFECGHEHGVGDRCISFHYTPEFMEGILAATQGARRLAFTEPQLPPCIRLAPLIAGAEAARDTGDAAEFEEVALRLAGAAASSFAGNAPVPGPTASEERRIAEAVRHIAAAAGESISLGDLAGRAGLSPYHFLRTFHRVAGMTPYQFVLRTRLHRAAVRLRTCDDTVSAIAFEAGFNDLSTFNRRFRRVMGASPVVYRRSRPRGRGGIRPDRGEGNR
jgi:AraC-like DNA-binding protein